MSYILEALKRAERERALGDVPTLTAPFQESVKRRPSLWPWVLGALFVVNAAVLAYLYWPVARGPAIAETARADRGLVSGRVERPSPPAAEAGPLPAPRKADAGSTPVVSASPAVESVPQPREEPVTGSVVTPVRAEPAPVAVEPPAEVSTPVVVRPAAIAEVSRPAAVSNPEPIRSEMPPVVESRRNEVAAHAANEPNVLAAAPSTPATVVQRASDDGAKTVDVEAVPSDSRHSTPTQELANQILALRKRPTPRKKDAPRLADSAVPTAAAPPITGASPATSVLPLRGMSAAFQSALPEMRIAALMYFNEPARRVVIINGRRYREGELVEAKVPVNEITRDGVVMTYQGKTFLLPQFR